MTAGADAFASGLFTRFDLTVLVSEPTRRGVGVYRQYAEHARGHGVALRVLGNKVDRRRRRRVPAGAGRRRAARVVRPVRVGAGGRARRRRARRHRSSRRTSPCSTPCSPPSTRRERDWAAYHRGTVEFHLRNAAAWGNRAIGVDLAAQVDPDFVPGPGSVSVIHR